MYDWSPAMNDDIRVSDADREHVAGRLQEHFAQGRLTRSELDERLSAAFGAKTYKDLRSLLSDLPEPALTGPLPPPEQPSRQWAGRPVYPYRRRSRLLPLVMVALFAAIVLHATAVIAALALPILLFMPLIVLVTLMLSETRPRRRMRRRYGPDPGARWDHDSHPPYYDWRQR